MPQVRQWGVLDLEGLDAEGERARTELADALHALDAQASRFVEPREEAAAKKAARSGA
jgi:acyl-[acyl-carrier-protein] desaturase